MTDVLVKIRKLFGFEDNSDKRKRRADDTEIHHFTKYRRVCDDFPKFISKPIKDDSRHKAFFTKLDQRLKSSHMFGSRKSKSSHINGNAYADNEYSDDDEVYIVTEQPIMQNSTNSNERFTLGGPSAHMSLPPNRKFITTPTPPLLLKQPLSRGAIMLSRVPGLHPIDKTRRYGNSYGAPMQMPKQIIFHKPNDFTVKNNVSSFQPNTVSDTGYNRNLNSILTKTYNLDKRRDYHELLKKYAPTIYKGNDTEIETKNSHLTVPVLIDLLTDDEDEILPSFQATSTARKEKKVKEKTPEVIEISDSSPAVTPINTLDNKFSFQPEYHNSWLLNTTRKYNDRDIERRKSIAEHKESLTELTLNSRKSELEIQKKLQDYLIISDVISIETESETEEIEFPEISKKERDFIRSVTSGPPHEVIITKFNLRITRRDLCTLLGDSWLNDEVINFYMNLLMERSELKMSEGLPKIYAMNTFFIPKILQSGHDGVRRWTRKIDLFSYDVIPVPVHVGQVHWCMAIIHLRDKTIKYYDSMGQANQRVLSALELYLKDESLDKKKVLFNMKDWKIESVKNVPRQMNGSDCGVFSCMFAEYITRNKDITFTQENMPYFRQKMILEIASGKLLL